MSLSLRGVPVPLLFVAGAACGVLLASLIVLCTHSHRTAQSTTAMLRPAIVAPDPMFDTPPAVEPASLTARPPPQTTTSAPRPVVKKAVTRNNVRRHHRPAGAGKPAATGDLLTAAL